VTRSSSSRPERLRAALAAWAATAADRLQPYADRLRPHADRLQHHAGRLIEAVDPGPGPDIPRVPLDTLLDDADSSDVAAGPDRTAEAGQSASPRGPR
jgi:hypothetical protein